MFMSCIRIPSLPQNHEDILLHYIPEVLQFCLSHLGGKYFRMSILYKIQGRFSLTVSHIHVSNCPSITAYRGGSSPLWLAIPHYAHGSVQLLLHWSVWYLCQCHITTAIKSVSIYCNTNFSSCYSSEYLLIPVNFPILCPWDSLGKNTGVDCHALLQEIFMTQGSNWHLLCLLHWQVDWFPTPLFTTHL